MAEIVAAAAAVIQFVDVAVRLSSCLGHLCSEVRNVPHRFHQLQIDLRQQIEIAQHIQAHQLPAFSTAIASSTFDTPLLEYITLADELRKALDKILAKKTDGLLQRGWVGLCSLRKKEDVLQMCDRLEQRKGTLSMWLSAANLKLSSNVTVAADQIRLNVEETLILAKTVNDNSSKAVASTELLFPQLEQIGQMIASSSQRTDQVMRDVQLIKTQAAILLANADAKTLESNFSQQISTQLSTNTDLILRNLQQLSLRPGATDFPNPISANDRPTGELSSLVHQRVANSTSSQCRENSQDSYFGLRMGEDYAVKANTRAGASSKCTCRTVNNTRRWQPLSILLITRAFRTQHFSYCPEYNISEQSLELTMQFVPPSWLLSRTIDFGFQVKNWSTMRPTSICPIMIGTSRLVDSKTSPAFCAIANAEAELYSTGPHHIVIPRLQQTLQNLFDQQKASPLDTDCNGRTLLHEILFFYTGFDHLYPKPGDEYVSLVQFLLNKGADPNISDNSTSMEDPHWYWRKGGTTLDHFMAERWWFIYNSDNTARDLSIIKRLEAAGAEFSKPFRTASNTCRRFRKEIEDFTYFEDQIDLCELGGFVPMILQQHETSFKRAVARAKLSALNRSSPVNGLAPVHFAVTWPIGLKILIDRGVNVNAEDHLGRRPVHLAVALGVTQSVEHLLNADCGLFTPSNGLSLLQQALIFPDSQRQRITDLIVVALIDRHSRLLDMARMWLPPSSFSKLNVASDLKNEQHAPEIIESLVSRGMDIPEALELDGKGFYGLAVCGDCIPLTPSIASAFWDAGFQNIDEPNEDGLTPILQGWLCANFEMVAWFAEKGISLSSRHRDAPLTGLHFYAMGFEYRGLRSWSDTVVVSAEKDLMARIQDEVGLPYDDCTCPCCPKGCTPVKFLVEERNWPASRKYQLGKFLELVEPAKPLMSQYIFEYTRCLLFEFLGGMHTCCDLFYDGRVETRDERTISEPILSNRTNRQQYMYEYGQNIYEHSLCCLNGIPIPQRGASPAEDADGIGMTLDSLMSHYDEMARPDTMPPEEQPFHYINWVIAEGYLTMDVRFGCDHDHDVVKYCQH